MAARSKFLVDVQYLLGDTLIRTGTAVIWLIALLTLYTHATMPSAIADNRFGYWGMLAGMFAIALGLWQLGRVLRRAATISDV